MVQVEVASIVGRSHHQVNQRKSVSDLCTVSVVQKTPSFVVAAVVNGKKSSFCFLLINRCASIHDCFVISCIKKRKKQKTRLREERKSHHVRALSLERVQNVV